MKELCKTLRKSADRLKSEHEAEVKHAEGLKAKREKEEEKNRQVAAKALVKQGAKPRADPQAMAKQAEVVAQRSLEEKEAAEKTIMKIDFESMGHPPMTRYDADDKNLSVCINWNLPFVLCFSEGTLESKVFEGGAETNQPKVLFNAFRAGFTKAAKKTANGRLAYTLPSSEAINKNVTQLSFIAAIKKEVPKGMLLCGADVEKFTQAQLFGFSVGVKNFGCEPRHLPTVKLQVGGRRFVVVAQFSKVAEYLGTNSTYTACKDAFQKISAESADQMAKASVPFVHGFVGPDTMLYLPAGCIYAEIPCDANNFGIRMSFLPEMQRLFESPFEDLHALKL
eukprot:6380218-Pyramimonas_sp.AAC.1